MIQTHPKRMHHGKFMEEASTRQRRGCFFNLHLRDMHWTLLVKREIQEQTQLHPPFLHALYGQLHSRQGGRRQRRRRQMPGLTCDHLLDPLACRPILPASIFVKWCDLLVEQKVVVGFERFYCPNQECSALIVNECGGVVVVKVEEGDGGAPIAREIFHFCFECESPWLPGCRCSERDEMREMNGELFGKLVVAKKWSRCPTCGHCVELVVANASLLYSVLVW